MNYVKISVGEINLVCEKCKNKKFLSGRDLICLKCNKINTLSFNDSIELAKLLNKAMHNFFQNEIKKYDKDKLIIFLLEYRERMVFNLFFKKYSISLEQFLSVNLLIKTVMDSNCNKEIEKPNFTKIEKLVDAFTFLSTTESWIYQIKDKLALFSYKENIDFRKISSVDLSKNFSEFNKICKNYQIYYSEEFSYIYDTLNIHLQMSSSEAKEYYIKHKSEYEKAKQNLKERRLKNYSPEEYIKIFYDFITSIYYGLLKNQAYVNVFDLRYLQGTSITPSKIIDIRNQYSFPSGNGLSAKKEDDFNHALERLNFDKKEIYDNLVFSEKNSKIFPFFLKFNGYIINSYWASYLISMFTYVILEEELFQKIHNKKSIDFEKKDCKKEFENIGYTCWIDIKDKKKSTLQIDLIAHKEKKLFVCEIKMWDIKKYYEQKIIHEHRERDLKGIIDGVKYTKGKTKSIPSLISKIEFINNNLERWNLDKIEDLKVDGLVITKSYPPIKEYKKINFISIAQVKKIDKNF